MLIIIIMKINLLLLLQVVSKENLNIFSLFVFGDLKRVS